VRCECLDCLAAQDGERRKENVRCECLDCLAAQDAKPRKETRRKGREPRPVQIAPTIGPIRRVMAFIVNDLIVYFVCESSDSFV